MARRNRYRTFYELVDICLIIIRLIVKCIAFFVEWIINKIKSNSPYGQFSKGSLKQNSSSWSQQAWWWSLDGWQFEQEVAKLFILQGYKATVTKGSCDGGVDIILKKDGYTAIVQCKHYQNPVPPEPIRALWGCKDDFGADKVILVASSGISQAGADFISNKPNFKVLNLDDIIRMSQMPEQITAPVKTKLQRQISNKNSLGRKLDL